MCKMEIPTLPKACSSKPMCFDTNQTRTTTDLKNQGYNSIFSCSRSLHIRDLRPLVNESKLQYRKQEYFQFTTEETEVVVQ